MPQLDSGWAGRDTRPEFREEKEKDSHSFNKNAHVPFVLGTGTWGHSSGSPCIPVGKDRF